MSTQGIRREKNRQEFWEITAPVRRKLYGPIKESIISGATCDPDMWPSVKSGLETILDHLLTDVEHELERNLETAWMQRERDTAAEGPKGSLLWTPWYRFRAFVLHHYLPHNKLLWGRLRDPVYLIIYLATFLPIHGVRVIIFSLVLLMLVFPGPPDEYQLINFILLCKGCQFLSTGLFQLLLGAMKYFFCYTFFRDASQPAELMTCIDNHGPGAHDGYGLALDYLGSITLVWIAFWLLPHSQKHAEDRVHRADSDESKLEAAEEQRKADTAGGRLKALMWYDRKCFFLSAFIALMISLPNILKLWEDGGFYAVVSNLPGDPHFNANVFWCCVFYSLTSLPFFPFCIAGLQEVMTHCFATGFNKNGACVAFELEVPETAPADTGARTLGRRLSWFAPGVTRVVRVLEEGRKARDGPVDEWDYKRGDLGRGMWAMVKKSVQPKPSSVASLEESHLPDATQGKTETMWWGRTQKKFNMNREPSTEEGGGYIHLGIANVQIPAEHVDDDFEGSAAFCIEVVPSGGLDGEMVPELESGELDPWFVVRHDADFDRFAAALGDRSQDLPDAPFPRKGFRRLTGEDLEQRRQQLEQWLNSVTSEAASKSTWAKELIEFLEKDKFSKKDINEVLAESADSTSNTLVKRLAHANSGGVLQRANKLGGDTSGARAWQTHMQAIVAEGRQTRGGDKYGSYRFGDFTIGLVNKMKQGAEKPSEPASSSAMPELTPGDHEGEQTQEGREGCDSHLGEEQLPQQQAYKFGDLTRGMVRKLKMGVSQPSPSTQTSSEPMQANPEVLNPDSGLTAARIPAGAFKASTAPEPDCGSESLTAAADRPPPTPAEGDVVSI